MVLLLVVDGCEEQGPTGREKVEEEKLECYSAVKESME